MKPNNVIHKVQRYIIKLFQSNISYWGDEEHVKRGFYWDQWTYLMHRMFIFYFMV